MVSEIIGIDLGYGDTKVVSNNNEKIKFPSRWSPYMVEQWGIGGSMTVLRINGGESFIFGEDAAGSNIREPLGDGRLAHDDSLPLIGAAIWLAGVGRNGEPVDLVIGSGTPLGRFNQELLASKEYLEGKTLKIESSSGEIRNVTIKRMIMRPQGVGAALYLLSKGMIEKQPGFGVVVDIGSRTTDVLTVNLKNMEPVVDLCFSIESGIGDAVSQLGRLIAKETGFVIPTDIAREALSRVVTFKQKRFGGPQVAEPILNQLTSKVLDSLRANLRADLDRLVAIIPVGGGASLIGDKLEELAPGFLIKIPDEDVQYANCLGYKDAAQRSES